MRFKKANDAFREQWNVIPEDITETDKGLLDQMLSNVIESFKAQGITDYDKYYFAFIECVESVFPDEPWYENLGLDIRQDLFNTQNPEITKQHILDSIIEPMAYVEKGSTGNNVAESFDHPGEINYKNYIIKFSGKDGRATILDKNFKVVRTDVGSEEEGREYIDSITESKEKDLNRYEFLVKRYGREEDREVVTAISLEDAEDQLNSDGYVEYWDYLPDFNYDLGASITEDTVCKSNGKWTNRGNKGTKNFEEKFLSEGYDVTDRFNRLLSRYDDEIDVIPEEYVYDYSHFKLVKSADDAEKVDYHSDHWGSANSYREEIVDFMSSLESMIGGVYSDEEGDSYKIVGLLIDKQYTSLSNCYVLVKDVVSGESLKEVFYLDEPVHMSTKNFNDMCRDNYYLQSLSAAEFNDLRNQVVKGEFTKAQLINEIRSDPTLHGETMDSIERVLNQYIDNKSDTISSNESLKETLGRDIISMLDKRSIEEIDGVRYAYDYLTQKDLAEVKDIVLKLLRKEFPNSTFEVYSITLTYDELSMGVIKDDVDFNRGISIKLNRFDYGDNLNKVLNNYTPQLAHELIDEMKATIFDMSTEESLKEDTVKKSNGKWTNRGNSGKEHGEFKTKKEADAQRKAMFANGYKESYTSNRRLDILFDIVDDSFPEVRDDILREDFITEAIRLTSIPGVKRDPSNDFSDDGNRFTAYIYKDTVPISYLKSNGDIYLTIAFHHLPDINFREYRKFDSYKVADDFNGVSESSYNPDVFARNLELAYNDIVNFRNNIEDADEDEIDRRIEEINKSCEEYKEKVKNYLNSRIDKIMNLTPSQFRQLQGYVKNAGTSTANYIKDLSQSSKRDILSQDINDLKRNIAHTWNFKYIEELLG